MRTIDADHLRRWILSRVFKTQLSVADVVDQIDREDTIELQPEIIRCKNCKHRHLDGMIWNCPFGLSGGEDFFCAYGAKDGDSNDE